MHTSTIWITLIIVALMYGIPAAVRRFQRELADERTGMLAGLCAIIISVYVLGHVR